MVPGFILDLDFLDIETSDLSRPRGQRRDRRERRRPPGFARGVHAPWLRFLHPIRARAMSRSPWSYNTDGGGPHADPIDGGCYRSRRLVAADGQTECRRYGGRLAAR